MNTKDLAKLKKASLDITLASDNFIRNGIIKIIKEAGADNKAAHDVVEKVTNYGVSRTNH